ncbi:MAG: phosphomannomutase/phosphoglucomutase [Rickettsiaceae bacterium]
MISSHIFRLYDIRGKVTDLNYGLVYNIGYHFTKMNIANSNTDKVCIAYDSRLSSRGLLKHLSAGIIAAKGKICALGLIPTPALYFADKYFASAISVMITGSHNPIDENGFKLVKGGISFFGDQIADLRNAIEGDYQDYQEFNAKNDEYIEFDIRSKYTERILRDIVVNPELKIAWDISNGAASSIVSFLNNSLSNHNIFINKKSDGTFPAHSPDPTKASNLEQLIDVMSSERCDFGVAFDGDADRLVVITKSRQILRGDQLSYVFIKSLLIPEFNRYLKYNGESVVVDIKTSKMIIDKIQSLGVNVVITKTGHPFIKKSMKDAQAIFGGEMSGHMFFADKYDGYDDGIYAALRLIDLVSRFGNVLDQWIEPLLSINSTPEIKIAVNNSAIKFQTIDKMKEYLRDKQIQFNNIDGIRVEYEYGWWLIRASNTEDFLVVRFEANNSNDLESIRSYIISLFIECNFSKKDLLPLF